MGLVFQLFVIISIGFWCELQYRLLMSRYFCVSVVTVYVGSGYYVRLIGIYFVEDSVSAFL